MKKKRNQIKDMLNAIKAKQRAEEIALHGKPISISHVVKNKKKYTRKIKHKKTAQTGCLD